LCFSCSTWYEIGQYFPAFTAVKFAVEQLPQAQGMSRMASSEDLRQSVVLVTSNDPNNRKFGTSFVIYKDEYTTYLLTCAHVVRDVGGPDQVVVSNYPAKVIASGPENGLYDLAVLQIEKALNVPFLTLNPSGKTGNSFITAGFQSFDNQFLIRTIRGTLDEQVGLEARGQTDRVKAWDLRILDDYHLQPGYSGSPVVDEANMTVLGIVSHRQGEGEKGLAISVEALNKIWLKMPPYLLRLQLLTEDHYPSTKPDTLTIQYMGEESNQDEVKQIAQDILSNAIHSRSKTSRRIVGLRPQDVTALFKNRYAESVALREYLTTAKLISVVGHGGTGKTALVCKVLADLEKATDRIGGLIYFTAANIETVNLESVFTAIGQMLDCEKEMIKLYNDSQKSLDKRIESLLSKLRRDDKIYILLFDNFEKYQDEKGNLTDQELMLFLEMTLSHDSALRIIITTRVIPRLPTTVTGFSRPISLDQGLPVEYAAQLLAELDPDNLGGLQDVDTKTLRELAQRAGGYPRALQAIASLLREDLMLTPADLLAHSELFSGDIIDGLVREALMRLDVEALQVMQALAVYGQPVPEAAITYLLTVYLDRTTVRTTLQKLVQSYFVIFNKTTKKFNLHPIDRAYVYQQLPAGEVESTSFTRRSLARGAADYFAAIQLPEEHWRSIENLQPQLAEFEQRLIATDYSTAARLLDQIDKYLLLWGHAHKVREMRIELEDKLEDKQLYIHQSESLGLAHKGLGALDRAIDYFQRMLLAAREVDDKQSQVFALNELSNAYRRLTRYKEAIESSQDALRIAREVRDRKGEGDTLGDLGKIHWCLGHYEETLDYCQQALVIIRDINDRNSEAYILGTLGNANLSLKRLDEALQYYQQALEAFREINNRQGEAYVLQDLGYTYLNLGELDKAAAYCKQGLNIYNEIENQRGVGHCAFVLARIFYAKKEFDTAGKYAERSAASLAETNVPETAAAGFLVSVIRSAKSGDGLGEVHALLECARSPANTGDLRESLDFAMEARHIAEVKGLSELLREAESLVSEILAKISTNEMKKVG
jgi:tetratricopeptide (TPR) repeat protein